MRNQIIISLGLFFIILFSAFYHPTGKTGHIYKVDLEVAEDLSRMAIDHYSRDGKPAYKGETELEMFSKDQVNDILDVLDQILTKELNAASISHEPAKESVTNTFGNMASNSIGKSKMRYFPKNKLKKVKADADEYYEIEIDFAYGGGKGRTVVMDKIKKVATIKFNVKTKITAYDRKGNEIWEQEETVKDFSSVFEGGSTFEIGEKWFEVSRAPVLGNGKKEAVGDNAAKNVHTDEFWPLSLDEIKSCTEVAVAKTLK